MRSTLFLLIAASFLFTAILANTEINFIFADLLNGVNGGGSCGNSSSTDASAANDAYYISQTIERFFSINDLAANDVNVSYDKYAPLFSPYSDPSITLTTGVAGSAATTYSGVAGLIQYLSTVASSRSVSHQILSDFVYTFSADGNSVSVSTVFQGLERLSSELSFQSFYGNRVYTLVRSSSAPLGWAVTSISITRVLTDHDDATDTFDVAQTIELFFGVNDLAANDVNVTYDRYAPLFAPYSDPSITLTTVNGATSNSYSGVAGLIQYLSTVASSRSVSHQILSDFVYTFSADDNSVSVSTVFQGVERITSNLNYQTFYGRRVYTLTRNVNAPLGWAVTSITITRLLTLTAPDLTAQNRNELQDLIVALVAVNTAASEDTPANVNAANYGSRISPLVTSDFTATSGNVTYTGGVAGAIQFLQSLAGTRRATQQVIGSYEFNFNADQTVAQVTAQFSGWEQLANGNYQSFFGTRFYTAELGTDGVWRASSLSINRAVTFAQTLV